MSQATASDLDQAGISSDAVERIWSAVTDFYDTGVQPMITFCLRKKGEVILHRSLGTDVDTPICIYSASKAITGTLMHLLEEDGVINLQDKVVRYLPDFATNGKADVTIEDLLVHRAGVSVYEEQQPIERFSDFDYMVELVSKQRFTRKGIGYHATSAGYILGAIAKKATGRNLQQILRERITAPLGMSTMAYGASPQTRARMHDVVSTGWPVVFPMTLFIEHALGSTYKAVMDLSNHESFYSSIIPSGNIVATADDMSRFFQMLLNGGELDGHRFMKRETVDSLTRERARTWMDNSLLIPMTYSAGMMLGDSPFSVYGPGTSQAFGHLGFVNVLSWADPERDIAAGFLNTGKPLFGPHLFQFQKMMATIANETL